MMIVFLQSLQCFDSMDNSFGKLPENKRRNRFGSIIPCKDYNKE